MCLSLLGTLCLLAFLRPHYVYAQYQPLVLFHPSTGNELDPQQLRLARQTINDNVIQLPSLGIPCSCQDFACKCCLGIRFGGINQTTCIKIEYEWRIFGVRFYIEWNDRLLTTFGLSPANMPDYCASLILPVPFFSCLRLSNIEIMDQEQSLHLCTSFVFKLLFSQLFEYKFTCMRLGPRGIRLVGEQLASAEYAEGVGNVMQNTVQTTNNKLLIYDV